MKHFILALCLMPFALCAQEIAPAAEDPIHQQIRDMRDAIVAAIESRDVDKMLVHAHPDIVVTWQNGETCHGIDELRAFYDRMGKDAFVGFKVAHKPDQLSVLHGGDTAIAVGLIVADYKLLGKSYEFTSRWTATLVQKQGKWLVSGYHVSLNALDNPILDAAKSLLWIAGIIGLVVGLLLALVIGKLRHR